MEAEKGPMKLISKTNSYLLSIEDHSLFND